MVTIGNYHVKEKVAESANSILYRASLENSTDSYIIKILRADVSNPSNNALFKQEFSLLKNISIDGMVKYIDCVTYEGGYALVLEDFVGLSLLEYINKNKITIDNFLFLAKSISRILGQIHEKHIVHKDIKPSNILTDKDLSIIKITDFGISYSLDTKVNETQGLEGTLSYMSPEQTGRMNRAIDYRTDLYSLGATFYHIITGQLPFPSTDPIEIIHCHIAKKPVEPHIINPAIPEILSKMIMKLLEKNPDERYQNSFGLYSDLDRCTTEISDQGLITPFTLGLKDISLKFSVPHIVYGRDNEKSTILDLFKRSLKGPLEILFLTGQPGIGKSVLVNDLQPQIIESNGVYIWGKYDPFRKNVPYSGLLQAFTNLINKILVENTSVIESWRTSLLSNIGKEGLGVLADMLPALKHIVQIEPRSESISIDEFQTLFNQHFIRLLKVFTSREHPLVLFLDDLQWADFASFILIDKILHEQELTYFFFIGSFRSNEFENVQNLVKLVTTLRSTANNCTIIDIGPLTLNNINEFISNFLRCDNQQSMPLSRLLHTKTGGNPFFLIQILKHLYENKNIRLDPDLGWQWDIAQIQHLQVSENVVELMIQKISTLPEETKNLLTYCACIGNRFDLDTLSTVTGKSPEDILQILGSAMDHDLLHRTGEYYVFHHDRIQEAAYAIIHEDKRAEMHYTIGTFLLTKTPQNKIDAKLLYIVNQLNAGSKLITTTDKTIQLIELNVRAAVKSKAAAAFDTAFTYAQKAVILSDSIDWSQNYEILIPLYQETTELAFLNGKHSEMNVYAEILISHSKSPMEQVKTYDVLVKSAIGSGQLQKAIDLSIDILNKLNYRFPVKPTKLTIIRELIKTKLMLRKHSSNSLLNLPEMSDPVASAAITIMLRFAVIAYWVSKEIFALTILFRIQILLKKGLSPDGVPTWVSLGILYNSLFSDYETAYKYASISLALMDRMNTKKHRGQILMRFYSFIHFWKMPMKEAPPKLNEAFALCMESGDIDTASINAIFCTNFLFFGSEPLHDLMRTADKYCHILEKNKMIVGLKTVNIIRQIIENLVIENKVNNFLINGSYFDENEGLDTFTKNSYITGICSFYTMKLYLYYIYGCYEDALSILPKANEFKHAGNSTILVPIIEFLETLTYLQLSKANKAPVNFKKVKYNLKRLKKCAFHCPSNFLHKQLLIEAEIAAIKHKYALAEKLYDKALQTALTSGFTNEAAIICETACKFYTDTRRPGVARVYFNDAIRHYTLWGALAKVSNLKNQYPVYTMGDSYYLPNNNSAVTISRQSKSTTHPHTGTRATSQTQTSLVDVNTIIKSSQELTAEINFQSLIQKTLTICVENTGANNGFLIFKNNLNGVLTIEAQQSADELDTKEFPLPFDSFKDISHAVLNYSYKTNEYLVLNNACEDARFSHDEYIRRKQIRSVICFPVKQSGKVICFIYLENNQITNIFTFDKIKGLEIVTSHAAISIENALIYTKLQAFNQKLETQVLERTKQLVATQKDIRDILNSIDDAIFTINADLTINSEHSRMAEKLFACNNFTNITLQRLLNLKPDELQDFKKWISYVFSSPIKIEKWSKHSRLNPVKEIIKTKNDEPYYIRLDYQPIFLNNRLSKIMVLGRDITDQKKAEENFVRAQKDKEVQMERVYGLVCNDYESIKTFISNNSHTADLINTITINSASFSTTIKELYRAIHTIKGVAGTMGFSTLEQSCHILEDQLKKGIDSNEDIDENEWRKATNIFIEECQSIRLLQHQLFYGQDNAILLRIDEYKQFVQDVKNRKFKSVGEIAYQFNALRFRKWSSVCEKYQNLLEKYAIETGKEINPLVVVNGGIPIENESIKILDGPLTHCVRNALDHGIEDIETRSLAGKGKGTISLSVNNSGDILTIDITDDGAGMDTDLIAKKAIEKGLTTENEVAKLDNSSILSFIFYSGFSTKETVSAYSGRGVGMDSVKNDIENAGGKVSIRSDKGIGTTISLAIPIKQSL
jgi:predicted ATPase/GAF domain-containing protein/HPt (histidine-containing phosphotransfer) domain-containing protein